MQSAYPEGGKFNAKFNHQPTGRWLNPNTLCRLETDLSRTWWLTTNTKHQLKDVSELLSASGQWSDISITPEYYRLVATSNDSTTTLVCSDIGKYRPGTAMRAKGKIETPSTLIFTQELSRSIDHCGRLDQIYQFAFSIAKWDTKCNLYFELEDLGIFKRINGNYTVNPDSFFARSLASLLTFPYELADSDKRNDLLVTKDKNAG